ncbi:MAG: DUF3343 domain-containing protein [Ruminococcus sp.]|nr:DUF3343 domain-containing protein [Ruminococcus sp.]
MEKELIMFPSITYAIKARDTLKKYDIMSMVERTPMDLKVTSCGYSLYVQGNIDEAMAILRKHNIKFLGKAVSDGR